MCFLLFIFYKSFWGLLIRIFDLDETTSSSTSSILFLVTTNWIELGSKVARGHSCKKVYILGSKKTVRSFYSQSDPVWQCNTAIAACHSNSPNGWLLCITVRLHIVPKFNSDNVVCINFQCPPYLITHQI